MTIGLTAQPPVHRPEPAQRELINGPWQSDPSPSTYLRPPGPSVNEGDPLAVRNRRSRVRHLCLCGGNRASSVNGAVSQVRSLLRWFYAQEMIGTPLAQATPWLARGRMSSSRRAPSASRY